VQEALIDLLDRLQAARRPSAAVRLISGTTVSLLDRITAGTFSARLFYRLNVIHLTTGTPSSWQSDADPSAVAADLMNPSHVS
jgi:transcriptional regulator of acetoin/glycerol metabolism